ncbi:MAG: GNAT family N-acetyltransferase [Pseudomonadota bacterium]|nr:GNAT family N-acetyltransferase [Pseudomonadota bacterium]
MVSSDDPHTGTLWRVAAPSDVERISAIEKEVHTLAPERLEVFHEKIVLFGDGCRVLIEGDEIVGYGIAYPWLLNDVPALDTLLGSIPSAPECLFIHDVAMLPNMRGKGAGGAFVRHASILARTLGLTRLALVSVYDTHHLWARCGFAVQPAPGPSDKLAPYGSTARYMVAPLG